MQMRTHNPVDKTQRQSKGLQGPVSIIWRVSAFLYITHTQHQLICVTLRLLKVWHKRKGVSSLAVQIVPEEAQSSLPNITGIKGIQSLSQLRPEVLTNHFLQVGVRCLVSEKSAVFFQHCIALSEEFKECSVLPFMNT